jgi:AsmA protein
MKKSLKVAGIVIGIFLVLLIAAVVIVPLIVDPNNYKDRIVALVEKQTGRHMKIEGDIALSVFPWLGLKLGAVELGNAAGFEAASFARIEELKIRVRIIPLLSRQVEADVVTLRGLAVNLERDKNGRTNWDDLVKAEPEKKPEEGKKEATAAAALAVGGVDIRDGSVTWTDRVSGERYSISDLSVKTSAVTPANPVDVKIGFQADTGAIGLKGRVESSTRIHASLKDEVYRIENLQIKADLQGTMLPGGSAAVKAAADIEFAAGTQRLKFTGVKLEAGGLSLPPHTAAIVVESDGTGDLAAQVFDVPGLKATLTMTGGGEQIAASLTGKVRADLKAQKATVDALQLEALGIKATGGLAATKLQTAPQFTGTLAVAPFNPKEILGRITKDLPNMADPAAMGIAEMTASLNGSADKVSLDPVKVRLDDTRVEGNVGIDLKPVLAYTFDIRVDDLDVDRYLPPLQKDAAPAAATPGAAAAALPLDALKALNLDGKLAVGKLKISNVRLQDIRMQARSKDGLLVLNPLSAALYGGTYQGNVTVDARGEQPRIALDEKLANVQVGPLLKDFQGRALLTGLTSAGMKLAAVGADADAVTRTLTGNVDFQLADGTIQGMDIVGDVCRALSGLGSGSLKKEDIVSGLVQMVTQKARSDEAAKADSTAFSELRGSMAFADGIGTGDGLILKSPLLRVEAAGKLDLPNQYLDYQATVALVKSCEGQGGKGLGDLSNLPIPVAISGPFQDLSVKPDIATVVQQIVQRRQAKAQQAPAATQAEQPSADQAPTPAQQPAEQPEQQKDSKTQVEDAVKDVLQKGLQDLFKKQ